MEDKYIFFIGCFAFLFDIFSSFPYKKSVNLSKLFFGEKKLKKYILLYTRKLSTAKMYW